MSIDIRESVEINRPAVDVWNAIADYSFDLEWRKGLTHMTPDPEGPAAMGTKIHEVVVNSGREYVADTIVTEFDPGVSYRFTGDGTIGGLAGGREVEPTGGDSAIFSYSIQLDPRGKMRILGPVLRPMIRSNLKKDLQKLKALLEAG